MAARRRNWPLRLTIVVVVLVGLFVAADRIAVAVAQNLAAEKIQESQHLSARPDVDIAGFPFLTQLASAHYDSVQITAHDIPVGPAQRTLDLDTVTVHLNDVTTADNYATIRAASATADARVTFADLARTLGVRILSSDGPDRIKASVTVTIAGQTITGGVSARVTATSSAGIEFSDVRATANGAGDLGAGLGAAFKVPIPLSGLPFNVQVTGLSVDSAGLVVQLAGRDLTYTPS